jgi:hypothetical protein
VPVIVRPEATTTIGADRDDEVLACGAGGAGVPCDARSRCSCMANDECARWMVCVPKAEGGGTRSRSVDGELFAIRSAIVKGCSFENCNRIVIFTDSIGSAKRAVDPSVHSGQAHSLAVCKTLAAWLSGHPERKVLFVETPSKLKWGIQHKAHLEARGLPPIPHGATPITSLDGMRKHIADSALDAWTTQSKDPDYLGHQFLVFRDPKGKPLRPMYVNGGTWLRNVNEDNLLCARFPRAVLNHAPTGEYYRRFHIPGHETHECECGCLMQTRHHIFTQCGVLDSLNRTPCYV